MLTRTLLNTPFSTLSREMDRLFDTFTPVAGARAAGLPRAGFPALNVWQTDEALVAEAELPGFKMDDLELLVTDDTLTIKGRRQIHWPEQAEVIRAERAAGEFERTLSLPFPIDADRVDATLTSGILRITMPKSEAVRPRKITISAGTTR